MERKNMTLGWKLEKGSLEQKWENFWSLYEVLYPFQNQNLNPLFQNAFLRILESITLGLDACQIAIFKD